MLAYQLHLRFIDGHAEMITTSVTIFASSFHGENGCGEVKALFVAMLKWLVGSSFGRDPGNGPRRALPRFFVTRRVKKSCFLFSWTSLKKFEAAASTKRPTVCTQACQGLRACQVFTIGQHLSNERPGQVVLLFFLSSLTTSCCAALIPLQR